MSDTDKDGGNNPSRRGAMQQMAAGASLAALGATQALAQNASLAGASTPEDFVRLQKQLSNWNRWGATDQMGAVNLITPAKRKAAVRLVREGVSFSCARNAEIKEAVDNPAPIVRKTTRTGASVAHTGIASTSDTFFISYHGMQGRLKTLTAREVQVFSLVVTGMLNKQIAAELVRLADRAGVIAKA